MHRNNRPAEVRTVIASDELFAPRQAPIAADALTDIAFPEHVGPEGPAPLPELTFGHMVPDIILIKRGGMSIAISMTELSALNAYAASSHADMEKILDSWREESHHDETSEEAREAQRDYEEQAFIDEQIDAAMLAEHLENPCTDPTCRYTACPAHQIHYCPRCDEDCWSLRNGRCSECGSEVTTHVRDGVEAALRSLFMDATPAEAAGARDLATALVASLPPPTNTWRPAVSTDVTPAEAIRGVHYDVPHPTCAPEPHAVVDDRLNPIGTWVYLSGFKVSVLNKVLIIMARAFPGVTLDRRCLIAFSMDGLEDDNPAWVHGRALLVPRLLVCAVREAYGAGYPSRRAFLIYYAAATSVGAAALLEAEWLGLV